MRAFLFDAYRRPLHAADVPEPTVGDRDVLISVAAAGVNQLDERIRLGEFKQLLRYPRPLVLGHDVAGTVVEAGRSVQRFRVGDRVFARPRDGRIGTFAERIAVDEADVAVAPSTLGPDAAASLPLVALTAWQALVERGQLAAGQRVLIHAGAGGVGTVAIQLAKYLGAFVATTASRANTQLVRDLGADQVIDYRDQRFEEQLSDFDLVLDSLGAANVQKSLTVVRPGGTVIGISGPPTPEFADELGLNPALRLAMAGISRPVRHQAGKAGVDYRFLLVTANGAQLADIARLVEAGAIRPVVGATYSFDDTPVALDAVARGGVPGKTVVVRD